MKGRKECGSHTRDGEEKGSVDEMVRMSGWLKRDI